MNAKTRLLLFSALLASASFSHAAQLLFSLPDWIQAPLGTHIEIPVAIKNLGDTDFTIHPDPRDFYSTIQGNFWVPAIGYGDEFTFNYESLGRLNAPKILAPWGGFYDKDFFEAFDGELVPAGETRVFDTYNFNVAALSEAYFSSTLGANVGKFQVDFSYRPNWPEDSETIEGGGADTLYFVGDDIKFGPFGFLTGEELWAKYDVYRVPPRATPDSANGSLLLAVAIGMLCFVHRRTLVRPA